jgi:formylglycine-generating enzyme required for sulfatase activity
VLLQLDKEFGNVSIDSNILSDIYIGDTLLGKTPFKGLLHAVNQTIVIKQKNYRTYTTSIKPNSSFDTQVLASLIPEEEARFNESPSEYITKANQTMKLLKPDMIVMGAKRSEIGQRANETIRRVKLTKPFYLSIHEVTNLQYSLFKKNHLKPDMEENHPVTNISWNEAAIYCNWLSSQEGFIDFYRIVDGNVIGINYDSNGYRLPTESEWSWTARSENKKNVYLKYPWGNSMPIPKSFANFADESSKLKLSLYIPNYSDSFDKTAPVGSFTPNKKGIFDLAGNVSEYVNDFYSIQPENQEIYINYLGPKTGNFHVTKGSNWQSASNTQLRYAYRDKLSEGNEVTGFRIARWLIGIRDEK